MNIFRAIDRKLKENISKSCSFFKKIVKLWKNDLTKLQQLLSEIFLQFVIFSTISLILLQYNFSYLLSFWANKWNTSHWVNYANIRVFSDTCFPLYVSLDSIHIRENLAQRKPLYLHILCSVQLSLWVT